MLLAMWTWSIELSASCLLRISWDVTITDSRIGFNICKTIKPENLPRFTHPTSHFIGNIYKINHLVKTIQLTFTQISRCYNQQTASGSNIWKTNAVNRCIINCKFIQQIFPPIRFRYPTLILLNFLKKYFSAPDLGNAKWYSSVTFHSCPLTKSTSLSWVITIFIFEWYFVCMKNDISINEILSVREPLNECRQVERTCENETLYGVSWHSEMHISPIYTVPPTSTMFCEQTNKEPRPPAKLLLAVVVVVAVIKNSRSPPCTTS